MPYILQKDRKRVDKSQKPETEGELNYLIYSRIVKHWKENPCYNTGQRILKVLTQAEKGSDCWGYVEVDISQYFVAYSSHCNPIIRKAIISCVRLEFYRRYLGPYEETKRLKNGDI